MADPDKRILNNIDGAFQAQMLFNQTQVLQEHNDVVETIREVLEKCAEDDEEIFAPQCQKLANMLKHENYDRIEAYEILDTFRVSAKLRPLAIVMKMRLNYAIDDDETLNYNLQTLKQALDKDSPNYKTHNNVLDKLIEYGNSEVGQTLSSELQLHFYDMLDQFKDTNRILAKEIQEYLQRSTNNDAENLNDIWESHPMSDDENDNNSNELFITPQMLDILTKAGLVQYDDESEETN